MASASTSAGKEDDDESSSSSSNEPEANETLSVVLHEFREQWQQELRQDSPIVIEQASRISSDPDRSLRINLDNNAKELLASTLFMEASELEKFGKVFEAMSLYRRATQLVPNIGFRVYERRPPTGKSKDDAIQADAIVDDPAGPVIEANVDAEEENLENVDLKLRFQALVGQSTKLFQRTGGDDRLLIVTTAHFSDLPMELILHILRWVVTNDLDIKSLEAFASICRGCYLLARDSEIWRHICMRVWGVNMGALKDTPFSSWREMYIQRPRILFHGCYISRATYYRCGENSFQDRFYRPMQMAQYYRYFRFFAGGKVLMLTTADEPQQCVAKLKQRCPTQNEVFRGHYRLVDDTVVIAVRRHKTVKQQRVQFMGKKLPDVEAENGYTCYMELQIHGSGKRPFSQLHWKNYSMVQTYDNQEHTTQFELTMSKYPPFYFSRVKSYDEVWEGPLK